MSWSDITFGGLNFPELKQLLNLSGNNSNRKTIEAGIEHTFQLLIEQVNYAVGEYITQDQAVDTIIKELDITSLLHSNKLEDVTVNKNNYSYIIDFATAKVIESIRPENVFNALRPALNLSELPVEFYSKSDQLNVTQDIDQKVASLTAKEKQLQIDAQRLEDEKSRLNTNKVDLTAIVETIRQETQNLAQEVLDLEKTLLNQTNDELIETKTLLATVTETLARKRQLLSEKTTALNTIERELSNTTKSGIATRQNLAAIQKELATATLYRKSPHD